MSRRLYVYYRVPEAALAACVAAAQAMQAALVAVHPGLQAELLRRPEGRDAEVTLMETYAGGLTPALLAALDQAASALPQPRHAEWFDTFEPPPTQAT
jgi:hypothetical protein